MQDKKLILIVEDEHVNCEILAMILQGSSDILIAPSKRLYSV